MIEQRARARWKGDLKHGAGSCCIRRLSSSAYQRQPGPALHVRAGRSVRDEQLIAIRSMRHRSARHRSWRHSVATRCNAQAPFRIWSWVS
jgi:hypothetical protein